MPQIESGQAPPEIDKAVPDFRRSLTGGLIVIGLYVAVQLLPRPAAVKPEGWRLLGIFVATIGGLILQPIPGGALVLIAVTLAAVAGGQCFCKSRPIIRRCHERIVAEAAPPHPPINPAQ